MSTQIQQKTQLNCFTHVKVLAHNIKAIYLVFKLNHAFHLFVHQSTNSKERVTLQLILYINTMEHQTINLLFLFHSISRCRTSTVHLIHAHWYR